MLAIRTATTSLCCLPPETVEPVFVLGRRNDRVEGVTIPRKRTLFHIQRLAQTLDILILY